MSLKNLYPEEELCQHVATPLTPLTPPRKNLHYPPYHLWEKRNQWLAPWHHISQIFLPNLIVLAQISHLQWITAFRRAKQQPKTFWMIQFLLSPTATPAWLSPPAWSSPSASVNPVAFSTAQTRLAKLSQLKTTAAPLAHCISPIQWIQSSLGWIKFLPPSPGATRDQIAQDSPL